MMLFYCSCYALNRRSPLCIISCLISIIRCQPTESFILLIVVSFFALYRAGLSRLRTSRSHESLLCGPASSQQSAVQTLDLSSGTAGDVSVKPLHPSVLGEENCLQITRPAGNVYIACSNAEERDRWRNWYVALHFIGRLRLRLIIFRFIAV